jgi:hypothetical protein
MIYYNSAVGKLQITEVSDTEEHAIHSLKPTVLALLAKHAESLP